MPIGNLTSQIFANIYLNELDRFVKHILKPKAYLRYGDDFIMIEENVQKLNFLRTQTIDFLKNTLKLSINPKSDNILKSKQGLKFLGVVLWPYGRKLNNRSINRINSRLDGQNAASYCGLVMQHGSRKSIKRFYWLIHEMLGVEHSRI